MLKIDGLINMTIYQIIYYYNKIQYIPAYQDNNFNNLNYMIPSSASLTARYISNNPFDRRNTQNNYNHHLKKLSDIRSSLCHIKTKNPERIKIQDALSKYPQKYKSLVFQKNQDHKKQDHLIPITLKGSLHKSKSKTKSHNKKQKNKVPIKRSVSEKKRSDKILGENLILIQNLKNLNKTSKQMKLQIKQQIKDYLSKRAHVRRNVLPSQQKRHKRELTYSTGPQHTSGSLYHQTRISLKTLKAFRSVQTQIQQD